MTKNRVTLMDNDKKMTKKRQTKINDIGVVKCIKDMDMNIFVKDGNIRTDVRYSQENYFNGQRWKHTSSSLVFIDLEKVYNKVSIELLWWSMTKKDIPEKYFNQRQDMYRDVETIVTKYGKAYSRSQLAFIKAGPDVRFFLWWF